MDLDPGQVLTIASAYRLSQLVYACASLGIPDVLSNGPRSSRAVAAAVGSRETLVSRLLRAAASEGVIRFEGGEYTLNDFSRQLLSTEGSLREFVLGWSVLRPGFISFAHLDEAIRTGRSGVELAFGERFHSYMRSHPDDAHRYEAAMEETVEGFREVAEGYDFSQFRTIADIGGGQGTLLVAILERFPEVTGVLFDLPDVVAGAPDRLAAYPQRDRISIIGGDMFEKVPGGCDAYLFSTVLRCFEDNECLGVLRACVERMEPDGHLLAVEMVMPDGLPDSPSGLADLQALVVYGGKDRTQAEWTSLLSDAGFNSPTFHPVGGPYMIVDATKR